MSRPIIFLDIDGVLVTLQSCSANRNQYTRVYQIDPVLVERLQRICKATKAQIVITSTWRLFYWDELINRLMSLAPDLEIIGQTPNLNAYHDKGLNEHIRGDEIGIFLDTYCSPLEFHRNYIILDDDSDFLPRQKPYLIQTKWDGPDAGLQEEHVDLAINILTRT